MSEQLAVQGLKTAPADIVDEGVVELIAVSPFQDIRPYEQPGEDTVFPLEYAFHLLDGVRGRTVIDFGCGTGMNTVILAKLGAKVISIDNCDASLELTARRAHTHGVRDRVALIRSDGSHIPVDDGCTDRVLCHGILRYPDPLVIARQIRRISKPGGRVVFHEKATTVEYAGMLSRAVGIPGRLREFWLTTGLLCRIGIRPSSLIGRATQQFDSALFRRFPFTRSFASSFVWEARKES